MMIDVKSCTDAMPVLSGLNGSNTQTSTGCAGTNVCFSVFSTDTNQTDSTFISADSLSPFTITHRGGVKDSIDICWNTQPLDVMGSPYFFRFTVRDNHCPETATTSQVFRIDLKDSTSTFCRQLTSIEDEKELQFSMYPNPADGLFHLNFPFGTKRMIQIYDLTGKKSFEYISLHDEKNIDVTLPTGMYFVKVTDSVSGKTVTKRIVSMK